MKKEKLHIALFQADTIWKKPIENLEKIQAVVNDLSGETDLLLLPEMCLSGFHMNPGEIALQMDSSEINILCDFSSSEDIGIYGSFIIEENNNYYNRGLFFKDGKVLIYDKRHLFSYAGEEKVYTAGKKNCTVEFKGWKIRLNICYDLRFPEWSRNTDNYDVLINVANWPAARKYAWNHLLIARAIENQAYVLGVNRCGKDGNNIGYAGESQCLSYDGSLIQKMNNKEAVKTVSLNREELVKFRNKYPFLKDRDVE